MKQTVKTYVGLAVSLPFAVVGGALLIVGAVCNVARLHGRNEELNTY